MQSSQLPIFVDDIYEVITALLLLAIITFGTAGGFNVGSKLSMAICAENTNIY